MKKSVNIQLSQYSLKQRCILLAACGLGSGLIRPAPGTWGTLPGLLLAYFLMPYPMWHGVALVFVIVLGVWLCQQATNILGVHDHGSIVIDEIAGILLTLLFFELSITVLVLGFIWFRLFDIIKPPPIAWVDRRIHGGLGIMLDDLIAGFFAWLALWFSLWVIAVI